MKKILLLLSLILILGFSYGQIPTEKKLVADETWIVASGKTSFRVITSNDTISNRFLRKYQYCMTRFTHAKKKDRNGEYWERSYYFKNEDYNTIALFINNKFK